MSIFSKIRNAKKVANEHKRTAATAKESKAEGKRPVYRQVPTHAAQDVLLASAHESAQNLRRIQEQQRRSKAIPLRTGSDMSVQRGQRMPSRERSADDISDHSVTLQKRTSQALPLFQTDGFEVPNPYGFHPHSKRGSASARNSRRNSRRSSAISTKKGKTPLSIRISEEEIPEMPSISSAENSAANSPFASSSKFHESLPKQQYQTSQAPHKSSLKSETPPSRPERAKSRVIFDFDQLDKYDDEFTSPPPPIVPTISFSTPEYEGSQSGRLSPIPQSPIPTDTSLSFLRRLTLNMKASDEDWFTKFSTFESTSEFEDITDATVETTLLADHIPDEPSTPAFALEQDLSLLCNFDSGAAASAFEDLEEDFWKLSAQHHQDEPAEPLETFLENGPHTGTDSPAYPTGAKEGLSRPPYPANPNWNPRWGPDVSSQEDGKDVLAFAQQLREQDHQIGRTIETAPPLKEQSSAARPQTLESQLQQTQPKTQPRAEKSKYQSHDSESRLLEDRPDIESAHQVMAGQDPVSPSSVEQSSYMIDPTSFHHDRRRVPKALSLRSPHSTPSPERQTQYSIFPSPVHETSNIRWNKAPPDCRLATPRDQKEHSKYSDWLSDDEEMWPIITHEPQSHTAAEPSSRVLYERQHSASSGDVSPLDEVPAVRLPVGQVPESYGHARNVSSSTGMSTSSGRDRLRFPSRESSQRIRTESHTSYETWLSGRTESPTAQEPLSPQYEHTITNWGPTNSPMCIPEVTLPAVSQQYARFNDPGSIKSLYETVISPTTKIIPQRSMPNLKGSQASVTQANPPPVPRRSLSFTSDVSPRKTHKSSHSHSRGMSPTNFTPPRASISERAFLLQDPAPTLAPVKKMQALRPETPLVTILEPFPPEETKSSPNKLTKKKGGRVFSMWARKKDGRGSAPVAAC